MSWSSVRGRRARVTKVTTTGKPIANACAKVVTSGFITVSYSPEVEEGDEILVKNAAGALCVNDKSCDTLKRINVEVEFCQVDPSALTLMTGNVTVLNAAADPVGNRVAEDVNCDVAFALEVWSDVPGAADDGAAQYGYFLTPNIVGGTIGEISIENDAATFTVTSSTKSAEGWGYGPYGVDGGAYAAARTVNDGATTNASTTVTSATAAFTVSDVGRTITGAGIPGGATIVSRTNATTVVISAAATATATGVSLTIGAGTDSVTTLLTPFIAGQHMDLHLTTVAPPAAADGCTAVTAGQVTTSETGVLA